MSRETDEEYGARRELAERRAAEKATYPAARDIHNALADRYLRMARARPSRRRNCEQ